VTEIDDALADRLFEAGCDDALVGSRDGVAFLDFEREANSFPHAVVAAIADVVQAKTNAAVARIEPDDAVTASEIARRLGRSRESVRQLANGMRGPGGFPTPIACLTGTSSIWSWADVLHWFDEAYPDGGQTGRVADAVFVAETNAVLAKLTRPVSRRADGVGPFMKSVRVARSRGGVERAMDRFLARFTRRDSPSKAAV
jgi:hypothetical protein